MCDKFDFDIKDIGDALLIPPWLLEYYGYAESFRSVGSYKIDIIWIKGYRWELDDAFSVIQGRQLPVPQCEPW
jgi:hypothetical protein